MSTVDQFVDGSSEPTTYGHLGFHNVIEARSIGATYILLPSTHRYIDMGFKPETPSPGGGSKSASLSAEKSHSKGKGRNKSSKTRGSELDY